jgi:hypothetical protein
VLPRSPFCCRGTILDQRLKRCYTSGKKPGKRAAVTAQHWFSAFQHDYLDYLTAGGGVAGGAAAFVWSRLA